MLSAPATVRPYGRDGSLTPQRRIDHGRSRRACRGVISTPRGTQVGSIRCCAPAPSCHSGPTTCQYDLRTSPRGGFTGPELASATLGMRPTNRHRPTARSGTAGGTASCSTSPRGASQGGWHCKMAPRLPRRPRHVREEEGTSRSLNLSKIISFAALTTRQILSVSGVCHEAQSKSLCLGIVMGLYASTVVTPPQKWRF